LRSRGTVSQARDWVSKGHVLIGRWAIVLSSTL
jgi:hypothetical protein